MNNSDPYWNETLLEILKVMKENLDKFDKEFLQIDAILYDIDIVEESIRDYYFEEDREIILDDIVKVSKELKSLDSIYEFVPKIRMLLERIEIKIKKENGEK